MNWKKCIFGFAVFALIVFVIPYKVFGAWPDDGSMGARNSESIIPVSGQFQTIRQDTVPSPLIVRVVDKAGIPLTNKEIEFVGLDGKNNVVIRTMVANDNGGLATLNFRQKLPVGKYKIQVTLVDQLNEKETVSTNFSLVVLGYSGSSLWSSGWIIYLWWILVVALIGTAWRQWRKRHQR